MMCVRKYVTTDSGPCNKTKGKVVLVLAIQECVGVEVYLQQFLISAGDRREWFD
jgi:hypothetical protein